MIIKIYQEKYTIEPVRKALKRNGFRYSKKESCFIGKITDESKVFLKLLDIHKQNTPFLLGAKFST